MKVIAQVLHGNEWMNVHEGGYISRPSIRFGPSLKWRILGAVRRNNFGHVVERYSLEDLLTQKIQWQHSNGKQMVFIIDLDHGGIREWRSPNHSLFAGA